MQKIFILHGWAIRSGKANQKIWQPFINLLNDSGFQVYFLKIPGLSSPLNEVWGMNNFVKWLDKQIEQFAHNQQIVLLGHSFGGQLAIKYTANHLTKVKKLILIDSAGIRDMAVKAVLKRTVFLFLAKLGKLFFTSQLLRNLIYKVARETDYKNAPPLLRRTMSKVLDEEILIELPMITCPVQIIWGENDKTTPVKHAFKMKKLIKNSSLAFIKNGRHSPQFTHVKEVARVVKIFLKRS